MGRFPTIRSRCYGSRPEIIQEGTHEQATDKQDAVLRALASVSMVKLSACRLWASCKSLIKTDLWSDTLHDPRGRNRGGGAG
jgi:hypothetical protein